MLKNIKTQINIIARQRGRELAAGAAGVQPGQIVGQELYLYVREKGHFVGRDGEWILAPRLDDQQCAYGVIQGLLSSRVHNKIAMAAVFHNEEAISTACIRET